MKQIIAATYNKGKLAEISDLLTPLGYLVTSLEQAGVAVAFVEDGSTFEQNALIKARAAHRACEIPALADDSGLEVDRLAGAPGIYSARYGDPGWSDQGRCRHLLDNLSGVASMDRGARFVCVLALVWSAGDSVVFRGELEGHIAEHPAGAQGFGYDPVFIPQGYQSTLAELGLETKNQLSHRAKALGQLATWLREYRLDNSRL